MHPHRLRHLIPSPVTDWLALLGRFAKERAARGVGADERRLARELVVLRQRTVRLLGPLFACASCARGRPLPHGRFAGGFCCGASTAELFTEEEVFALALGGTAVWHLRPRLHQAGCLFRGARGCALAPRHRPVVCVAHLCRDLERELARRGDLEAVETMCLRLRGSLAALAELRRQRLDRQWLEALED